MMQSFDITPSGDLPLAGAFEFGLHYKNNVSAALTADVTMIAFWFSADGTKLFTCGATNDKVYRYDLSTPWLLSSMSFVHDVGINTQTSNCVALALHPSGTKMFVIDSTDNVDEYALGTPWDLTTASYTTTYAVGGVEASPTGLAFGDGGSKMYLYGGAGIHTYSLSTPYSVASGVSLANTVVPKVALSGTGGFDISSDGHYACILHDAPSSRAIATTLYLPTAWSFTGAYKVAEADVTDFFGTSGVVAAGRLRYKADGSSFFVMTSDERIGEVELATAWLIDGVLMTSGLQQVQFDDMTGVAEASQRGLHFTPDRRFMFIMGDTNDVIYKFRTSLSCQPFGTQYAFDQFSFTSQEATGRAFFFSDDGMKLFVMGTAGDDLNEYNLVAPWVLTGAVFVDATALTGTSNPGMCLPNPTGTLIWAGNEDDLTEFSMTAWDASTRVATGRTMDLGSVVPVGSINQLCYRPGGLSALGADGNGRIHHLALSAPYDLTTATWLGVVAFLAASASGIAWSEDGTTFYTVNSTDGIQAYSVRGTAA